MDALPSLLMQTEECLRAARLFLVRRKDERDDKFDRGAVLSAAMKPLPFILPLPPFFAFWSVPVQDQAAPGPQAPQAAEPSTPTPWAGTSTIPGQFSPPRMAPTCPRRNADRRSELLRLLGPPFRIPGLVRTPEDVETHGRAEKQAGVDQEAGSLSIRALVTRFMHGP